MSRSAWRWSDWAPGKTHSLMPGRLPGAGGWSVAVQGFGAVGVPGGGGPIGIEDQGPAPAVNHDLMVEPAQQNAVFGTGGAAVRLVPDVVDFAGLGGLVAASGPPAPLVAQDDRVADSGRDRLGVADIQRQARPRQPGTQLPGAQEARQAARAGQQVGGLADDRLPDRLPRHPG